jgi:integrase
VLSDDELRVIWSQAETNGVYGALVRLLLLTAQRRDKVATMRWTAIKEGVWTIPTEKREKGNAGELRLPDAALAIIDSMPRNNSYVFGSPNGDKPLAGLSKFKRAFDAKVAVEGWTLHDLRRTARSLMARAGVRPDIAERVLGHAIAGVEGVYDRHPYFDEKAEALQRLARLIDGLVHSRDNVVFMTSA